MARDNELRPLWLEPLLDNNFYEHDCICEVHNQYCTFFCKMCKNKPLCESCWRVDAEAEHELHQFLQVHNHQSFTKTTLVRAAINLFFF